MYIYNIEKKQNTRHGFTLLFAMLTSSLLILIGFAIFNIAVREIKLSTSGRESLFAFYGANSGAECALFWDQQRAPSAFGSFALSGVVSHWALDETSGIIASDSEGSNDGTLNMKGSGWQPLNGMVPGALDFDAIDSDYVSIPDDPSLDLTTYTYAFWLKPETGFSGLSRRVLVKGQGQVALRSPGIFLGANDMKLVVVHSTDTGGQTGLTSNAALPFGTSPSNWTHVAVAVNTGGMKIYIDGALDNERVWTANLVTNNDPLYFGGRAGLDPKQYVDMELDHIFLFDRALSAGEIAALMGATSVTPPVAQGSDSTLRCSGDDINDPVTGWTTSGWDVTIDLANEHATTTFDVDYGTSCAFVEVVKSGTTTNILSRGYNTCNVDDPRRIERAIRVTY